MNNKIYSEELIHSRIESNDRVYHNLTIDCVYASPALHKNAKDEVISKLMGVGIQGGIRSIGSKLNAKYVVLFTTGEDLYWQDTIDEELGVLMYFGDNKKPGTDIHETKLGGNVIFREAFKRASSQEFVVRSEIPPFFVFAKHGKGRNIKFIGLAVPGVKEKDEKDWLNAVWGNRDGERFLNYKAYFTILDTKDGSTSSNSTSINLAWLNDIEEGNAFESIYAPKSWKEYVSKGKFSPLIAIKERKIRSTKDQLTKSVNDKSMLKYIHDYFIKIDNGYSFEKFAVDIIRGFDKSIISVYRTQPHKDGGFDGYGTYRIFDINNSSMIVDFFLEAKCYKEDVSIGVKQTSRLISRIKNRQFGIMFTTSFVANQAYSEILDDQHPIVVISGGDIIDYLKIHKDIKDSKQLEVWLTDNYNN